jgi:hypothetical protein
MHKLVLLALVLLAAHSPQAHAAPEARAHTWQHTIAEWSAGSFEETYLADEALRLLPGHFSGTYTAPPLEAPTPFTALLAEWRAHIARTQTLAIDVHTSVDGQIWNEWQPLQPTSEGDQIQSYLTAWGPAQRWLQYRVRMTAQFGAPSLDALTLTVVAAPTEGVTAALVPQPLLGVASVASADAGSVPQAIPYAAWAEEDAAASVPHQPKRIEIVPAAITNAAEPFAVLRALQWMAQEQRKQHVLPLHVVVDDHGLLHTGAVPITEQLGDADAGVIRIGVLLDANGSMGDATRAQVTDLIAWLVRTYNVRIENIGASPTSPAAFGDAVALVRAGADAQIMRWRRMFAGRDMNTLALFNPAPTAARATITASTANGTEQRMVDVPAGQRADVALNELLPAGAFQSVEVQANRVLHAERVISDGASLLGSTGPVEASRSWYFAGASPVSDTDTVLQVFNPAADVVNAQVVLYSNGAEPITHTTRVAPQAQTTIPLRDLLMDAQFGVHLVTTQPVFAERVVHLPSGSSYAAVGSTALERQWSFAEGVTTTGYTTTLYILNPWPQRVALTLQIMSEDGTSLTRRYAAPPHAHIELVFNDIVPDLAFAFDVVAERPVAVERVVVDDRGSVTAMSGSAARATRWTFAAGTTLGTQAYLLIANAQRSATDVEVRYILADGTTTIRRVAVPPTTRLTLLANDDVPDQAQVTTVITASHPVVAERTLVATTPDTLYLHTTFGEGGR